MSRSYAALLLTSLAFMPGCQQLAILFLPDTRPMVQAEFQLPRGKTAVLVDDFMVRLEGEQVKNKIATGIIELLKEQRALRKVTFTPPAKAENLKTEESDGTLVSIQRLGKQMGVDTVLYVNVTRFELQSDPEAPLPFPSGQARVKVIKIQTGERLWPIDIAGRSIRVRARREPQTLDADNRAKWADTLADLLAAETAHLFYDHREGT